MTVKKINQIQKEYLDFAQQQHTSILSHYENFLAILAKYEQATGNPLSDEHRSQTFLMSLYKERYSKLLAKLEGGEQQQEAHTLTGGAARLDGVGYPETLAKAKVIAEFHE